MEPRPILGTSSLPAGRFLGRTEGPVAALVPARPLPAPDSFRRGLPTTVPPRLAAPFAPAERVRVVELPTDAIAREVAQTLARLIRARSATGQNTVLGLATGSTPLGVYAELIRLHREEGLDFSRVVTFNLDEYFPMEPSDAHSYHRYMEENLFQHINIEPSNVHLPDGRPGDVGPRGPAYESAIEAAGGLDLQLLGIGKTGHIGFNEPGSGPASRTRLVTLDPVTRADAAGDFGGLDHVPRQAITAGVGTILGARQIILIATGDHKAPVVRATVEGEVTEEVPATFLQRHPHTTFFVDPAAASELGRHLDSSAS